MARKIKYGKILVVTFLTVLIWVWADLAQDEVLSDSPAVIVVDEAANPKLWVSFDEDSSADIRVALSGHHTTIANEKRRLREGKRLEFDFDAVQEKMDKPGRYTLAVLPFLQKDKEIKRLGLKVKSCEPEMLSVDVQALVKKPLDVRCVDENQNPIKVAAIEPDQVDMLVPEDWVGGVEVQLTHAEIEQARLTAIEKIPHIRLAADQISKAAIAVKITMPPEPDPRNDYLITATLGIALSPTLQGKYDVEVTNLDAVMSAIVIRATPDAKRAYELQQFPTMTLYVLDDDKKTTEEQRREVVYNFPEEFVSKGEIMLNQQPVTARFKLTPLPSARASSIAGD